MNVKLITELLGKFLLIEAALMAAPLVVSLCYRETGAALAFLITIGILAAVGLLSGIKKTEKRDIFAAGGLVVVGLAWLVMSLFGALPFFISGAIPNYVDALFETVSGFSTTGSTILTEIESLPHGILFWRAFTQWIGGMGVLVFMLAILPGSQTHSMHLMRAEVPGPSVGKLVSKISISSRILYLIYMALTALETVFLMFGGMSLFDALTHAFTTGGTGGFSVRNASIAAYGSVYIDVVITVFMLLFGINFNLYFFLLIGRVRDVFKNEELHWYLGIVFGSIALITVNITRLYGSVATALRYASFQVASTVSTTGYMTADFDAWPTLSQIILFLLMFVGGCAGSTGGGLKVMRIVVLAKSAAAELRRALFPRSVNTVKMDGRVLEPEISRNVVTFFVVYAVFGAVSVFLLSFDRLLNPIGVITSVVTCINNVGPGLDLVGPTDNFASLSILSKLVLTLDMLAGRLELYPVLILFSPRLWKK